MSKPNNKNKLKNTWTQSSYTQVASVEDDYKDMYKPEPILIKVGPDELITKEEFKKRQKRKRD